MRVHIGSIFSEWLRFLLGVPQGSVLGPLLFIIFTNDLYKSLQHSDCIIFADDTTVYIQGNCINDMNCKLKSDLNILIDWFRGNKLSLNLNKTNYMLFRTKGAMFNPNNIDLKFGSENIVNVKSTKFLGL